MINKKDLPPSPTENGSRWIHSPDAVKERQWWPNVNKGMKSYLLNMQTMTTLQKIQLEKADENSLKFLCRTSFHWKIHYCSTAEIVVMMYSKCHNNPSTLLIIKNNIMLIAKALTCVGCLISSWRSPQPPLIYWAWLLIQQRLSQFGQVFLSCCCLTCDDAIYRARRPHKHGH